MDVDAVFVTAIRHRTDHAARQPIGNGNPELEWLLPAKIDPPTGLAGDQLVIGAEFRCGEGMTSILCREFPGDGGFKSWAQPRGGDQLGQFRNACRQSSMLSQPQMEKANLVGGRL